MRKIILLVISMLVSFSISATIVKTSRSDTLFIFGVVDFYTNNCEKYGLTKQGVFFINKLENLYAFSESDQVDLMNSKEFIKGFESYSNYSSCSNMRGGLMNTDLWFIFR
jgi:hypothetical protein